MILSLLLYLYEAVLKKYKFHAYFYTSALIFYFTKKADKMQVLFIKKSNKTTQRESLPAVCLLVVKVCFEKYSLISIPNPNSILLGEELCLKQGRFDCLPKVLRDTKPTEQATLNTRFNLVDI